MVRGQLLRELKTRQSTRRRVGFKASVLNYFVQSPILRQKSGVKNNENAPIHCHACCLTKDESMIVDVSDLANEMRLQVRNYTKTLTEKVRMVGILAEGCGRSDAETYSNMIEATLVEDGFDYIVRRCPGGHPKDIEAAIREMNYCRPDIHGILVFYPIFPQQRVMVSGGGESRLNPLRIVHNRTPSYYLNPDTGVYYKTVDDYLRDCVVPAKDVEGVCHDYKSSWHRQLFRARGGQNRLLNDVYIPCTVTAVLKILETFHLPIERVKYFDSIATDASFVPTDLSLRPKRWDGCTVTVVNRSTILGRPLAALLAMEGATVYSVDETSIIQFQSGGRLRRSSKELTLNDCLRQSSIVVTAVPNENFQLDCSAIANHTTVIDVSENSNVDQEKLFRKRGIQLIPKIGKVTVAALEHNLIRLHSQQSMMPAQHKD